MGISASDLRRLTVGEFVALTDLAAGEGERRGPREATQADIDALLR